MTNSTSPYTEIILSVQQAMQTGWYGSFALSPSGDSYDVELDGHGAISCSCDSEQAQDLAREFAESWRRARDYGGATLDALHASAHDGAMIETAHDLVCQAAAAERYWGDDPVWGDVERAIERALDDYED